VQGIAGNDVDDGGGKIFHELNLTPSVAGPHGDGQHPQAFGAVMETKSASE
jgi:hypothetical protein